MIEIPVSDLLASDVGRRVVVARDGNTFEGLLTNLDVTRHDWNYTSLPKFQVRLVVKSIVAGSRSTQSDDKVLAEMRLVCLPLDYLIQVDRTVPND